MIRSIRELFCLDVEEKDWPQKKFLEYNHRKVDFFCDNDKDKVGREKDNVRVISVEEVVQHYREYLVIICSRFYFREMEQQLKEMNFPETHIYGQEPPVPYLCGLTGTQYFDVFENRKMRYLLMEGRIMG